MADKTELSVAAPETPETTAPVAPSLGAAVEPSPKPAAAKTAEPAQPAAEESAEPTFNIRFFSCCSKSLRRFSVALFVFNLFLIVTGTAIAAVYLVVTLGASLMMTLAVPILLIVFVLILLARFFSALIYGFAEVVEKAERDNGRAAKNGRSAQS